MIGNFYTCETLGLSDLDDERVTQLGDMLYGAEIEGRFFLGAHDDCNDGEFHEVSETAFNAVKDELTGDVTNVNGIDVPSNVTHFSTTVGNGFNQKYYVRKDGNIVEVTSSEYWDYQNIERQKTLDEREADKLKDLISYMDKDDKCWVKREGEDYHTLVSQEEYDVFNQKHIIQPMRDSIKENKGEE